jgi:hypothetical protein
MLIKNLTRKIRPGQNLKHTPTKSDKNTKATGDFSSMLPSMNTVNILRLLGFWTSSIVLYSKNKMFKKLDLILYSSERGEACTLLHPSESQPKCGVVL